jgi:hypothetical protein
MNNQIAFQTLKEAITILNNIKIPHFVMGGTLLGFVRNGDFILHDNDIDIGIFIENWSPKINEELQKAGFKWTRKLGTNESGLEYTFYKNNIQLDIFFWYKEQDYFWYGAWWKENKPENLIKLRFDKFTIVQSSMFNGELFSVPSNAEHWLEQIYGKDWIIPNQNYHWCASCQNIIQAPFDNKKEKTICLGMIVKNESKIIKETLEAAKAIIDYWVIIDTGSTDDTKEIIKDILKDIPGELIERPWKNFGYNRTELATLTKDKGDFSLILDADHVLEVNKLDKKLLIADWYMIFINEPLITYYYPLLLNNKYEWKSIGVTHEYWNAYNATIIENLNTLKINHRCAGDYRKIKFENDLKLLLEGIKQEPNNSRYAFYLAQTYNGLGNYEKAIEWANKRISLGGWQEEIFYSYYTIIHSKIRLERPFEEILDDMFKSYFYHPQSAESLYEVLRYCRVKKLYSIGYYIGKIAQQIKLPTTEKLFVRKSIYQYQILDELSVCAYHIGRFEESFALCTYILESNVCKGEDVLRIFANKQFSEKQLKKIKEE